jgi:hypothetical protein
MLLALGLVFGLILLWSVFRVGSGFDFGFGFGGRPTAGGWFL